MYLALVKAYEQLGRLDEALNAFEVGIEVAKQVNDILSLRNLNLDGGTIFLRKEEYEKARFYTEQALDLNNKTGSDPILSMSINQQLAIIAFKTGQVSNAKTYIEKTLSYEVIHQPGTEATKVGSLVLYSDIEASLGNGLKAHELIKEAKAISDSLTDADNARKIAELETIYETEKKEAQIELLEVKNEAANLRLIVTIIIAVVLIGGTSIGFIIYSRRRAELKRKEMKELKTELDNYGTMLAEKNKFMEQIQENLEELKIDAKSFQTQKGILSIVDSLSQNIQLTDQEEKLFKRIEQVNAGFFNELRKQSSEITQHDERLASLVQMGLSNKEIAPILGISPKSVNQARYRLKKKLKLEPQIELIEYLKNIAA
ncbi:MAG: LuxR C-terminal-related transcriptional regulator [Bacteroidota bacterium]